MKFKKGMFIISCIAMGLLADWFFIDRPMGLSVLLFVTLYYCLFFWQMKGRGFSNRKLGFLLMLVVLALSLNYFLYWNIVFYLLNLLVLPAMIMIHSVLITRKVSVRWNRPVFIKLMLLVVGQWLSFAAGRFKGIIAGVKRRMTTGSYRTAKLILIGLSISLPLVMLTGLLLVSADSHFAELISILPVKLVSLELGDEFFRGAFILLVALLLYSFLVTVKQKEFSIVEEPVGKSLEWESIIVLTVLLSLNGLYALFTFVQFQYFFSGTLADGFTYADYARRGFFELVIVTLINWSIAVLVIKTGGGDSRLKTLWKNALLTMLIAMSGIMLYSAWMRLALYEEAYGFTISRLLAHASMFLIGVILAFTLLKLWYERLSLSRFYIISFLLFYSSLNIVDLNSWIVEKNLQRYEESGKIDLYYLESLSFAGTLGLIELYESEPDMPGLQGILARQKDTFTHRDIGWQSGNLARMRAEEALDELELR